MHSLKVVPLQYDHDDIIAVGCYDMLSGTILNVCTVLYIYTK